jgi:hypothetical protein
MTLQGWLQIALYVIALTALTPLVGAYMARAGAVTGRRPQPAGSRWTATAATTSPRPTSSIAVGS